MSHSSLSCSPPCSSSLPPQRLNIPLSHFLICLNVHWSTFHCPTAALSNCFTFSLSGSPLVSLPHYLTVPVTNCPIASLSHFLAIELPPFLRVPWPQNLTASLSHSLTVPVSHFLTYRLPHFLTAHFSIVRLSNCPTLLVLRCDTAWFNLSFTVSLTCNHQCPTDPQSYYSSVPPPYCPTPIILASLFY